MKSVIVLAMHGAPPRDFPKAELAEYMSMHGKMEALSASCGAAIEGRYKELETKMMEWSRTLHNDPFYWFSKEIADELERSSGMKVFLGFNEFCAPGLDKTFESAACSGAERIFVVTAMMTRGGEHSEKDIVQAINRAKNLYPAVKFIYSWPYEIKEVADFLASHLARFKND